MLLNGKSHMYKANLFEQSDVEPGDVDNSDDFSDASENEDWELRGDAHSRFDVDERLDPFTAALRQELHPPDNESVPAVYPQLDKAEFTQRLLRNADTVKDPPEPSRTFEAPEWSSDLFHDLYDEGTKPTDDEAQRPFTQNPEAMKGSLDTFFGKHIFEQFDQMSSGEVVHGKHLDIPVDLLRNYSFERCKFILERSRHYVLRGFTYTHICLRQLWQGDTILTAPCFMIYKAMLDRILLCDEHPKHATCFVLALLKEPLSDDVLQKSNQYIQLFDFEFDHAATLVPSRHAKASTHGIAGSSTDWQTDDHEENDTELISPANNLDTIVDGLSSVLVIHQYMLIDSVDLPEGRELAEISNDETLPTARGEQVLPVINQDELFEGILDQDDFPVDVCAQ